MTTLSVDKCSGPDCACVIAAGFKKVKVERIQIQNQVLGFEGAAIYMGPPGTPPPSGLAMLARQIQTSVERNRRMRS